MDEAVDSDHQEAVLDSLGLVFVGDFVFYVELFEEDQAAVKSLEIEPKYKYFSTCSGTARR